MIAVDTNIIIRFLTHDDNLQYKKAFSIFNTQEVFIADTVILETEWVLRYAYEFSPDNICNALAGLFGLHNVHLSNPGKVAQAIEWHELGIDFSDAMHLSQCQQYEKLYTFDKNFVAKAKGQTNCSVITP
ncbi:MAG: type II toxin-antitoxin system VapC family toxin [Gammaproteobacteria bacterium]|jgi:predicted nucleic-acid-binding protein|nr:type II toxin-antitoxin system VapC family toxin [Gammaproteobacteria bacterium]MBT3726075.1 type II toxin-antitoxin system VapC family toxin [Gammaproteobacteria bacterium]MBT4077891.1 type II toxin-antitoxin system VapC family toxin [Gammaproteobacteria bacterium]MBT4195120.1 type II toxin-antitoxin system VapC family toxin [Gammaproteobacteria bacterium]MBT4449092.1 type II toxin-antitoxin system VapC family toxin [Gammaproteobacteria bacterium]